jgi:hypothetical protein
MMKVFHTSLDTKPILYTYLHAVATNPKAKSDHYLGLYDHHRTVLHSAFLHQVAVANFAGANLLLSIALNSKRLTFLPFTSNIKLKKKKIFSPNKPRPRLSYSRHIASWWYLSNVLPRSQAPNQTKQGAPSRRLARQARSTLIPVLFLSWTEPPSWKKPPPLRLIQTVLSSI